MDRVTSSQSGAPVYCRKNVHDTKTRNRFLGGFGAISIFLAVLVALLYSQLRMIKETATRITGDTLPCIYLIGKVQSATLLRYTLLTDQLNAHDRTEKAALNRRIDSAEGEIDDTMSKYEKLIGDAADRRLFEAMKAAQAPYGESFAHVLRLIRKGNRAEALNLMERELTPLRNAVLKTGDAEVVWNKGDADDSARAINAAVNWTSTGMLFCLAFSGVIAGIARNTQNRLRAERKWRESEERCHEVFERGESLLRETADRLLLATRAGAVGIWDYSVADNQSIWDDQMFRLYGMTANEFSGGYDAWQAGVHPEDRQRGDDEIQCALRGEKDFDTEFRVVWRDGSVHSIRALALVQRDALGRPMHMVGTNWDITAQKQAAQKLEEVNRKCEEAAAGAIELAAEAAKATIAKSRFLANMSHEIRTPMNGVIGMIQLLLETDLTQQQQQYATVVQGSGKALLALIDDILDLSKIEAGKITIENLSFNLRSTVEQIVQLLRSPAEAKGLQVIACVSPDVPHLLCGDPYRLRQVLTNLAANAIKFTGCGKVTLNAVLDRTIESRPNGKVSIRFAVTDTGIGIPPDRIGALFAPFTQADASTTRKYGGTGLGLAISKQLVEMMGGTIGVDSDEGKGSTFWFTTILELAPPSQQPTNARGDTPLSAGRGAAFVGRTPRILVAEDNITNRFVALAQLQKLGYDANAVNNGVEAVEAVERGGYDLVLMDCQMPVMDGFEAARRIRKSSYADIPIVALTASAFQEDRDQCLSEMNDFISKPVDLERLADVLARRLPVSCIVTPDN